MVQAFRGILHLKDARHSAGMNQIRVAQIRVKMVRCYSCVVASSPNNPLPPPLKGERYDTAN